jgi:hypothetical protein
MQLAAASLTLALQGAAATPSEPLETGKSLYQQARFPEAIETLRKAVERMQTGATDEQRRQRLADAYRYLGLAYFALGEREIARDAFKNVLSLNPKERLDPELYAPKVVELFEQARLLAVPPPATAPDAAATRARHGQDRPPFWPTFAVEAWGGIDSFPDVTAPSAGYVGRLKAGGFDVPEVAVGGNRGQLGGIRFSLRLGSGRDRLSLGLEPMIRSGNQWHEGFLGQDAKGQDYRFEHRWDLNLAELRFTWSHQVMRDDAWTAWMDTSYRNASLQYERYNRLTPVPDQPAFMLAGGQNVDTVHVGLNGLRTAFSVSRRLSRRLSIEGALGYTLALRHLTSDPVDATAPSGYEFDSSFDLSVGTRLALSSGVDFSVLYRRQGYGSTYLGDLRCSNYLVALTVHSAR